MSFQGKSQNRVGLSLQWEWEYAWIHIFRETFLYTYFEKYLKWYCNESDSGCNESRNMYVDTYLPLNYHELYVYMRKVLSDIAMRVTLFTMRVGIQGGKDA